jgi:hypothetical protein
MEDIQKFISGLSDNSFGDIVILWIVIMVIGAFMKHRGGGGSSGRGLFRMIGL